MSSRAGHVNLFVSPRASAIVTRRLWRVATSPINQFAIALKAFRGLAWHVEKGLGCVLGADGSGVCALSQLGQLRRFEHTETFSALALIATGNQTSRAVANDGHVRTPFDQ